jgi:hypothetical protein
MRRFGPVLCLALVMAAPADAHEPHAAQSGYVSSVTHIKPLIVGLEARVLGAQDKLFVRNWTRTRVVVAAHVIKPGKSASWHDHRIGWFHAEQPAVVRRDPTRRTSSTPGASLGRPAASLSSSAAYSAIRRRRLATTKAAAGSCR